MQRIGIASFMLALGLIAAPSAGAQSSNILVCRDGQATSATYGDRACDGHGGVDQRATIQARQNGRNGTYGANANRGVYGGAANGGNGTRGVYGGNGGVYTNGNSQLQCADGSWSTVGAGGCNRHGGVYTRNGNGSNGQWNDRREDKHERKREEKREKREEKRDSQWRRHGDDRDHDDRHDH